MRPQDREATERSGQRRADRAAAEELFDGGLVEVDLREPPSRAALALPDGRRSAVLEPDAGSVDVAVTFSDGTLLRTPADALLVGAADPGSAPGELDLMRRGLQPAQARDVLDDVVRDLGVDAAAAEQAFASVLGSGDSRVLETGVGGAERLVVELDGASAPGTMTVHYSLDWAPR